jgi:hypothetical protein
MSISDFGQFIEQYHRAIDAFAGGDPEPVKKLFSRRDEVTLANPLGPPVRGWSQVEQATDHAASLVREGAVISVESISENETADFAYNLETSGCGQRSVTPTSSRRSHCALRPSFDEKLVSGKSSIVMPIP